MGISQVAPEHDVSEHGAYLAAFDELVEELSQLRTILARCPSELPFLLQDAIGMKCQMRKYLRPEFGSDVYGNGCRNRLALTISSRSSSVRSGSADFNRIGGLPAF